MLFAVIAGFQASRHHVRPCPAPSPHGEALIPYLAAELRLCAQHCSVTVIMGIGAWFLLGLPVCRLPQYAA